MAALKTLWGWLSLVFHLIFTITLAGLGGFALGAGAQRLHLEMLPWSGATLAWVLLGAGVVGLASVILAARGSLQLLFLLWSVISAVFLTKEILFSSYRFAPESWRPAAYFLGVLWFSVIGACFQMSSRPKPGPRKYRVK